MVNLANESWTSVVRPRILQKCYFPEIPEDMYENGNHSHHDMKITVVHMRFLIHVK